MGTEYIICIPPQLVVTEYQHHNGILQQDRPHKFYFGTWVLFHFCLVVFFVSFVFIAFLTNVCLAQNLATLFQVCTVTGL